MSGTTNKLDTAAVRLRGLGLAAAGCLLSLNALAEPVTMDLKSLGYSNTSQHAVTSIASSVYSGTVDAGAFGLTTPTGDSFLGYCLELSQELGSGFQRYTLASFEPKTQRMLEGLFSAVSTFAGSARIDTGAEQAALQLAIWELTHEASGSFSLTRGAGSLFSTDSSWAGLNMVNLANGYLSSAANWSQPTLYKVERWVNASYQDIARVQAVPEAGTSTMMALGLLGVGCILRRAKKS